MENEVWSIIENLKRTTIFENDYRETLAVGFLIKYFDENQHYHKYFNFQQILKAEGNAQETLLQMFQDIENKIPYFKDVFGHLEAIKKLKASEITRVFYDLSSINIQRELADVLTDMLHIISMNEGKRGGGFNSPNTVNELAISILDAMKGSFYDGSSGYGGGAQKAFIHSHRQGGQLDIYSQELNGVSWSIQKIRLFISGAEHSHIKMGDVLSNPAFTKDGQIRKFDYVYMDPPFSLKINNYDALVNDKYNRFFYGMPPRSNSDFAFVSHALASLNEKGRGIVVSANGILFRGGAEGKIRQNMIKSDVIEAVISLPGGLYSSTSIPITMIVFNKNKTVSQKNRILFVKVNDDFISGGRNHKTIKCDAIQKIADTINRGKEINEFSTFINHEDLVDSNLNPSRYILPKEMDVTGFGTVTFNVEALKDIDTISLKGVSEMFRGFNVGWKNKEMPDGTYKIVRLSDVNDGKLMIDEIPKYNIENNAKIGMYKLQKNDVILSIRGQVLKVAIVPIQGDNLLLSQNFIGIRCKGSYNPELLKIYLESPLGQYLLKNKMSGTAIQTLSRKDVETLKVPQLSLKSQDEIVNHYKEKEAHIEHEFKRLETELEELKANTYEQMGMNKVFKL